MFCYHLQIETRNYPNCFLCIQQNCGKIKQRFSFWLISLLPTEKKSATVSTCWQLAGTDHRQITICN